MSFLVLVYGQQFDRRDPNGSTQWLQTTLLTIFSDMTAKRIGEIMLIVVAFTIFDVLVSDKVEIEQELIELAIACKFSSDLHKCFLQYQDTFVDNDLFQRVCRTHDPYSNLKRIEAIEKQIADKADERFLANKAGRKKQSKKGKNKSRANTLVIDLGGKKRKNKKNKSKADVPSNSNKQNDNLGIDENNGNNNESNKRNSKNRKSYVNGPFSNISISVHTEKEIEKDIESARMSDNVYSDDNSDEHDPENRQVEGYNRHQVSEYDDDDRFMLSSSTSSAVPRQTYENSSVSVRSSTENKISVNKSAFPTFAHDLQRNSTSSFNCSTKALPGNKTIAPMIELTQAEQAKINGLLQSLRPDALRQTNTTATRNNETDRTVGPSVLHRRASNVYNQSVSQ
jgi:hypothetical protein